MRNRPLKELKTRGSRERVKPESTTQEVERKVRIPNELGLHARPAALFVQLANKFSSKISVEKDGVTVDGKSIMGIMMLAAGKGSVITIRAKGADAKEAVDALVELVEDGFGEM